MVTYNRSTSVLASMPSVLASITSVIASSASFLNFDRISWRKGIGYRFTQRFNVCNVDIDRDLTGYLLTFSLCVYSLWYVHWASSREPGLANCGVPRLGWSYFVTVPLYCHRIMQLMTSKHFVLKHFVNFTVASSSIRPRWSPFKRWLVRPYKL